MLSPVAAGAGTKAHAGARFEPELAGAPGGELELVEAATAPPHAPGPDPFGDIDDGQRAIEEHHVDREPHADGVDAAKRIGEQQPASRRQTVRSEEAAGRARAEPGRDVDARDEHASGAGIEEFAHAASVHAFGAPRRHGRCAGAHATRAHSRRMQAEPVPSIPLRYAPRMLCEDFHSGDDVTLGFLGRTYSFARRDFDQRVVRAAVDLELVAKPVTRAEREDLVAAAIHGAVETPRSDAGDRIAELQERGGEDPVYWLRKLVFRSAWLDHRIKHGQVDVAFDDSVGAFRIEPGRYPLPGSGHPSFAVTGASA